MDLNRLLELSGLNESAEAKLQGIIAEKAPADQEDFVKSAKSDFKKRYGKRWKQVLYATANKRHGLGENEELAFADALFESLENQARLFVIAGIIAEGEEEEIDDMDEDEEEKDDSDKEEKSEKKTDDKVKDDKKDSKEDKKDDSDKEEKSEKKDDDKKSDEKKSDKKDEDKDDKSKDESEDKEDDKKNKLDEATNDLNADFQQVHDEMSALWPSINDKWRAFLRNEFLNLANKNKNGSDNPQSIQRELYRLRDDIAAIKNGNVSEAIEAKAIIVFESEEDKVEKVQYAHPPANKFDLKAVKVNDDSVENNKELTGMKKNEETKVNVPKSVKTSIDKRIKELNDTMEQFGGGGPVETARDELLKFKELLASGNLEDYQRAQVLYGTLWTEIQERLPTPMVSFLHTGKELETAKVQ